MISFIHHKGINLSSGIEQYHPQDLIYVDGRNVGIFGHHDGASVILVRPVSEAEQAEIMRMAIEKKGCEVRLVGPPPAIPDDFYESEDNGDE